MPRISTGTWMVSLGLVTALAANAQEISSPFAKKGTQAWESSNTTQNTTGYTGSTLSRSYVPPQHSSGLPPRMSSTQSTSTGSYQPPARSGLNSAPSTTRSTAYHSQAQSVPSSSSAYYNYAPSQAPVTTQPDLKTATSSGASGAYYPGRVVQPGSQPSQSPFAPSTQTANNYGSSQYGYAPQNTDYPTQYAQSNLPPRMPDQGGNPYPPTYGNPTPPTPQKKSWSDRLGLSNIAYSLSGFLKLGAAGTDRNTQADSGWSEDFIADGAVNGEISALTANGIEYGIGAEVRGQYDAYRRGFGGRVGDCPPTLAGCPTVDIMGTPTSFRGHTSQFYVAGPSNAKDTEVQLEGAYLFLRSAYGDVTVGRDDGAAYLFSLGAPSLVAVGASNSPVDYTGLDAVKTVNDASGFSEKITYTSPRLLGDHIIGVQFGASYAPDSKACGVDYCVRSNGRDGTGVLSPDIEDVFEFGVALDKTFDNGLSVEVTGTYAQGSESSALAVFDDLETYGLGVELGYMDWTVGGSYLQSNNGLLNGDYTAWDAGLTWQPGKWGVTLGYGHAEDENVGLTSDQALLGLSYDFNDNYRLGTGVQYIEREVPFNVGGIVTPTKEDAMSIFVEGRVTF